MSTFLPVGGLGGLAALGVLMAFWLRRRFVLVAVTGSSMHPTLRDGQRVLMRRTSPQTRYARGDVVVFRLRSATQRRGGVDLMVKRVAAVGGDLLPPWLSLAGHQLHVPPRTVVVRGDGARSVDSRKLGFIREDDIVGRLGV